MTNPPRHRVQLFGGKFDAVTADEFAGALDPSRNLYDSFVNAMVTTFVIVTIEDWNDYWVLTSRAVGPWCTAYFLILLIIGNYLVLNLVVAVVIGGYVDAAEQQETFNSQVCRLAWRASMAIASPLRGPSTAFHDLPWPSPHPRVAPPRDSYYSRHSAHSDETFPFWERPLIRSPPRPRSRPSYVARPSAGSSRALTCCSPHSPRRGGGGCERRGAAASRARTPMRSSSSHRATRRAGSRWRW